MDGKVSYPCPECGKMLTFDNRYLNLIDDIDIICPLCQKNFKGNALFKIKPEANRQVKTAIVGLSIKENFIDEKGTPGGAGKFYQIKKDITVIGRKSNSSSADIQIPSNRYMSRQHIIIENLNDGYCLKCAKPTNLPLVNGVIVSKDDSITLKDGDEITLGQCVIEWKYKPLDEDRSIALWKSK